MLRRITSFFTVIGLLFASLAPIATFAAPDNQNGQPRLVQKVSPEFESATNSTGTFRVIIQTKGRPSAAHDSAIGSGGGTKRKQFDALNTIVADVPGNSVAELAARDDIDYISPDRTVRAQMSVTREAVGAEQVQAGAPGVPEASGRGVGIAIIDSGISATHPDFQKNNHSRVVASVDFTGSGSPQTNNVGDRAGHGTGVAGVAAGNGAASQGYAGNYTGIAPEANLIDLKVLDENGSGRTSSTLEAINWAITNQQRFNIRVINLSLGTPARESFRTDPLCRAVARAVAAGIVVVCSAGNNGRTDEIVGYAANGDPIYRLVFGAINSPGMSPYAITVGATDSHTTVKRSDDTVASFSSKGPTEFDHLAKPDVVAPGRRIVAAMSQENPTFGTQYPNRIVQPAGANATPYAYFNYSGTSFAAPVVSGTVALMLQTNESLTPALVKAVLARSAQALPASQFQSKAQSVLSQGVGEVNAASAVQLANAIVPNADKLNAGDHLFRSHVTLSSLSQPVVIGGEAVAPSSRVLYADGVIFINHPVLSNGLILPQGLVLSEGFLLSDGFLLSNGIMLTDGIMLADGMTLSEGMLLGDGHLLCDGIVLGNGFLLSGDLLLGDSLAWSDGIMLADGVVIGDGMTLAEGMLLGDGITLGDGMLLGDGMTLAEGMLLGDGHLLGDGFLLTDGIMLADGMTLSEGMLLGDGRLLCDGIMITD